MPLQYTPHLPVNSFEQSVVRMLGVMHADGFLAQNILLPNVSHRYLPNEHDIVALFPWGGYTIDAKEYRAGYYRVPANAPVEFRRDSAEFGADDGKTKVLHHLPYPLHVAYQKATILHSLCGRRERTLKRYPVRAMIVVPDHAVVIADEAAFPAPGGGILNLSIVRLSDLIARLEQEHDASDASYPLASLRTVFDHLEAQPRRFQAGLTTCGLRLDQEVERIEPGALLPMTAYLGVHELTGTPVEVRIYRKWPWNQSAERFVNRMRKRIRVLLEARMSRVVTVVCAEDLPDAMIIAFCPYDGESLRSLVQRLGPIDADLGLELLCELCQTVAELHSRGIVHHDLRPDNVLVGPGLEIHRGVKHSLAGFTNTLIDDSRISTDAYADSFEESFSAPEMRFHKHPDRGTPKSDVYSIGRLAQYFLMGEAGYRDWIQHRATPVAGIGAQFNLTLERMTAHRAATRFADVREAMSALGSAGAGGIR